MSPFTCQTSVALQGRTEGKRLRVGALVHLENNVPLTVKNENL